MFPIVQALLVRWQNSPALRNGAWLAAEKALRLVLVTGVGFWVARHLGPGRFGILVTAIALVGLLQPRYQDQCRQILEEMVGPPRPKPEASPKPEPGAEKPAQETARAEAGK